MNRIAAILATLNALSMGIGVYILAMGTQNLDPFIPAYLSGYAQAPHAQLFVMLVGFVLIVVPPLTTLAASMEK